MTSDLRTFISDAEAAGRLYRVGREVDPYKTLGALADEADQAILFEDVTGYPEWTVAANLMRSRDMEAVALGVPRDEVVRTLAQRIDRGPIPHHVVADGPVKEVAWRGDEADLRRLPIAIHSELDGGPYIGSGIGVTVDPDTKLHNTTFPRTLVGDGRNCPLFLYSPHTRRIFQKFIERKQPMPFAIVIGHHPIWEVAAASSMHHPGFGELDFVGGWLGEDTEFVKCQTIDVDVPAYSEIVIEGMIVPGVTLPEGPFGNYLGTYASGPMARAGVQDMPVLQVQAITMRKNAIYRHLQSTVFTDHQRLMMLANEATLFTALREIGIDVHDVYCPTYGGAALIVVQMTPHNPGDARDALIKAVELENSTMGHITQVAVAVNRDVNLYDSRDLLWALTIRTNWARDVVAISGTRSSPLMPFADRVPGTFFRIGSKALVDATHLPPVDESEAWDLDRAWPMGKDTVSLEDYVDGYRPPVQRMERLVTG